jgi:uncharacterized protein (DUF2147 family)
MAQGSGEMKRLMRGFAAVIALCAPPAAKAADQIYGVWVRDGHPTDKLEFFDCAGKLCAKGIQPMLDGSPAPLILKSAAKTGPNSWKGDLFNPEDGKTYTGKISYDSPTQLTLTGCLVAFLCQSETWTRVSGPTKAPPAISKGDGKTAPKSDTKSDAKGDIKSDAKGESKSEAKTKAPAPDAGKAPEKSHDPAKAPAAPHDASKAPASKAPAAKAPASKAPAAKTPAANPAASKPAAVKPAAPKPAAPKPSTPKPAPQALPAETE